MHQGEGEESCSGTDTGKGNARVSPVIPQEWLLCISTEPRALLGSPTGTSPAPLPRVGHFRTGDYPHTIPFKSCSGICCLQTQLVLGVPGACAGLQRSAPLIPALMCGSSDRPLLKGDSQLGPLGKFGPL